MNRIIRKCVLIIVFSMFVPFFIHAQQKNTASPKKTVQAVTKPAVPSASVNSSDSVPDAEEMNPADVKAAIWEVVDLLKKEKESDPVPITVLMSYENSFLIFSKYPKIERDTGTSAVWHKNVSESLSKLAEIKANLEAAEYNKEEKQLEELGKAYKEFVPKIIYLLEHPQKLSEKK